MTAASAGCWLADQTLGTPVASWRDRDKAKADRLGWSTVGVASIAFAVVSLINVQSGLHGAPRTVNPRHREAPPCTRRGSSPASPPSTSRCAQHAVVDHRAHSLDIDTTLTATLRDPKRAGIAGMTSGAGAMVATAMRVVNAVPYVVAAEPGLLHSVDRPLTTPRSAFLTESR